MRASCRTDLSIRNHFLLLMTLHCFVHISAALRCVLTLCRSLAVLKEAG